MKFEIFAIDEHFNKENVFGVFSGELIKKLAEAAKLKSLKCLSFIFSMQSTVFNDFQAKIIKDELDILKQNDEINKDLLKAIEKGIEYVLSDVYTYLKFEPKSLKL